jgi:mannose-6-phosphate isomerase-like protein (cupin superfamily)
MKFRKEDGTVFSQGGTQAIAYTVKEDFAAADLSLLMVNGRHGRAKSLACDRFFFIIEGQGTFTIDQQVFEVSGEDLIVVPRETAFDYEGIMKVIEFGTPAFDEAYEVNLEPENG